MGPAAEGGGIAGGSGKKPPRQKKPKGKKNASKQAPPRPPLVPGVVQDGVAVRLKPEDMNDLSRTAYKHRGLLKTQGAVLFVPPDEYVHPPPPDYVTANSFKLKARLQPVPDAAIRDKELPSPDDHIMESSDVITIEEFERNTFRAQKRADFKVIRAPFATPLPNALKAAVAENEAAFIKLLSEGELVLDGDEEAGSKRRRRPGEVMYGVDVEAKGVYKEGGTYDVVNEGHRAEATKKKTKKAVAPGARVERPILQHTNIGADAGVLASDGSNVTALTRSDDVGTSFAQPPAAVFSAAGHSSRGTHIATFATVAGQTSAPVRPAATAANMRSNGLPSGQATTNAVAIVVPLRSELQARPAPIDAAITTAKMNTPPNAHMPPRQMTQSAVQNAGRPRPVPTLPHGGTAQYAGRGTEEVHTLTRGPMTPHRPASASQGAPSAAMRCATHAHQATTASPLNVYHPAMVGHHTPASASTPTPQMSNSPHPPRAASNAQVPQPSAQDLAQRLMSTRRVKRTSYQIFRAKTSEGNCQTQPSISHDLRGSPPPTSSATSNPVLLGNPSSGTATNGPAVPLPQCDRQWTPCTRTPTRPDGSRPTDSVVPSPGSNQAPHSVEPRLSIRRTADDAAPLELAPAMPHTPVAATSRTPARSAAVESGPRIVDEVLEFGNGNIESNPSTPRASFIGASPSASALVPVAKTTNAEDDAPPASSSSTATRQPAQSSSPPHHVPNSGSHPSSSSSQSRQKDLLDGGLTAAVSTQSASNSVAVGFAPGIPPQTTANHEMVFDELLEQGTSECTPEERQKIVNDCVSDKPITLDELRQKGSGREAVSHVGNINDSGILRHSPPAPGISVPMYYIGNAGSKFCVHVEDAWLNSISYNHRSGAIKTWYSVPPEYAQELERYAAEKIFGGCTPDQAAQYFAYKTVMLNPHDVAAHGIPVYRHHHTPGTIVMTACRGYHFGFNHGFNIAEAVNYADPYWFKYGVQAHEVYRKWKKTSPVCVQYLAYQEALSLYRRLLKKKKMDEYDVMCATKTAEMLKKYAVDGNEQLRTFIRSTGASLLEHKSMYHKMNGEYSAADTFGNGAGLRCLKCQQIAHFYAKVCSSCDWKESACCLDCKEGTALCKKKGHKVAVSRRHHPYNLLKILKILEELAGIKVQWKERAERYFNVVENFFEEHFFKDTGTARIKFKLSEVDHDGYITLPPLGSEETANIFDPSDDMDLPEQVQKGPEKLQAELEEAMALCTSVKKGKKSREEAHGNDSDSDSDDDDVSMDDVDGSEYKPQIASDLQSKKPAKRTQSMPRNSNDDFTEKQSRAGESKNRRRRSAVNQEEEEGIPKRATTKRDEDRDWNSAKKPGPQKRSRTKSAKKQSRDPSDRYSADGVDLLMESKKTSSGRTSNAPKRFRSNSDNEGDAVSKRRRTSNNVGDDDEDGDGGAINRERAGHSSNAYDVDNVDGSNQGGAQRPGPRQQKAKVSILESPLRGRPAARNLLADTSNRPPKVRQEGGSLDGPGRREGDVLIVNGRRSGRPEVTRGDEDGNVKDIATRDADKPNLGSPRGRDDNASNCMRDENHDTGCSKGSCPAGPSRNADDGKPKDTAMEDGPIRNKDDSKLKGTEMKDESSRNEDDGKLEDTEMEVESSRNEDDGNLKDTAMEDLNFGVDAARDLVSMDDGKNDSNGRKNGKDPELGLVGDGNGPKDDSMSDPKNVESPELVRVDKDHEAKGIVNDDTLEPKVGRGTALDVEGDHGEPMDEGPATTKKRYVLKDIDIVKDGDGDTAMESEMTDSRNPKGGGVAQLGSAVVGGQEQAKSGGSPSSTLEGSSHSVDKERQETQEAVLDDPDDDKSDEATETHGGNVAAADVGTSVVGK